MIKNITQGTIIAKKCRVCSNFITRSIGLMFSKKPVPTVLAFKRESNASIHMFFVKHFLDVLFLNDQWEVIELVQGLAPNSVYKPKKKAMFVIELPEGSIQKSKTKLKDIINFK